MPLQPQITIPKGLEGTPEMWIVAIRKGLETGRHDLARHAQHALHALGAKGADALARAFAREEEPEAFRMSIFGALLNADRERGLEVAREWLSRERGPSTLRTSVLLQYARSGPDELPAGLTRLLDDPETPKADRTSVLLALMSADPAAASERLRALMFSRDATEQAQARDLLRNARDPAFRDLVLEAARTDDARKRNQYVNALAAMKGAGWGRVQMTGEPDTFGGGDQRTAWASKKGEEGNVTVELDFPTTLRPERVRVHETFNPGAIIRVEGRAAGSEWIVLWEGGPKATQAPRWFEPTLAEVETAVATIRLTLDTNAVKGWNEIDAVQLVGDGQAHYATEARCSSCYAGDTGF
ncbi:MAG: hypothetical protein GY946_11750 [bacterium]|nr:hypothetical protein [bacterium]